ncbi:MAG: PqqD family protein [Bacteroidetes bacterium]|nr:MAG: PqqD family protein [Bacteroidota bacterium]
MKINKNIAVSETGFVFNPASGEAFTVNSSGTELLNLIIKGVSYQKISNIFLEKYDTSQTTFDQDYHDFVDMLNQYNLVTISKEKE